MLFRLGHVVCGAHKLVRNQSNLSQNVKVLAKILKRSYVYISSSLDPDIGLYGLRVEGFYGYSVIALLGFSVKGF